MPWWLLGGIIALVALIASWALLALLARALPPGLARDLARFLPDCVIAIRRLCRDPRVPRRAKVAVVFAALWVLSPIDLIPEFLPVIGPLDDVIVVALALCYAARRVPREAMLEAWPGGPEIIERLVGASATAGAAAEVSRSAAATAELFRTVGSPEVDILDGVAGGRPAVLASYPAPAGRPTVLLYAHHDVQPTGDPAAWTSPPFAPVERDGRLYGRGSADDKAGIVAHLTALRAHGGRPPVGVTVFVEGEEEIGSPTLDAFLARYGDRLAADVIVLADSANHEIGTPTLTTSLRGLVDCVVEVRALEHSVHSGMYGGPTPDALTALCRLLATLHDERGDVAIAGLVTAAPPEVDYAADRFRAAASVLDGVQLIGTGSITERLWTKPAVTGLAIDATAGADASNTLAP